MSPSIERVLNHMGATVPRNSSQQLQDLAKSNVAGTVNSRSSYNMAHLASYLCSQPAWADCDSEAKCVANRNIAPSIIGSAIRHSASWAPPIR